MSTPLAGVHNRAVYYKHLKIPCEQIESYDVSYSQKRIRLWCVNGVPNQTALFSLYFETAQATQELAIAILKNSQIPVELVEFTTSFPSETKWQFKLGAFEPSFSRDFLLHFFPSIDFSSLLIADKETPKELYVSSSKGLKASSKEIITIFRAMNERLGNNQIANQILEHHPFHLLGRAILISNPFKHKISTGLGVDNDRRFEFYPNRMIQTWMEKRDLGKGASELTRKERPLFLNYAVTWLNAQLSLAEQLEGFVL